MSRPVCIESVSAVQGKERIQEDPGGVENILDDLGEPSVITKVL